MQKNQLRPSVLATFTDLNRIDILVLPLAKRNSFLPLFMIVHGNSSCVGNHRFQQVYTPPDLRTCIHLYHFFNERCEKALEFYQSAIGAPVGMVQDKFGMGWMITVPEA